MAKASKATGFTIEQILNMDEYTLTHLNEAQLKPVVKQLANAANKRLKAMEKIGEKSPAYYGAIKSGGTFGIKGKDYSGLQSEVSRELAFLKHKTSTIKGWKQVRDETKSTLKEKYDLTLTDNEWSDFWEAYDKLSEMTDEAKIKAIKYDIFREIHSEMDDKAQSPEDIAIKLKGEVNKIYAKRKKLEKQRKSGGVSKYFK